MGMFIYKDNMKFDIAIFAGGLGSRLKNTESRPKPLVDINGKSLLSRLINSLEKTNLFLNFHILTCIESKIFNEVLEQEIKNTSYIIYEEQKRSGRIGALKNFLNSNVKVEKFFAPMNICPLILSLTNINVVLGLHSNLPWTYFEYMPGNFFKKFLFKRIYSKFI